MKSEPTSGAPPTLDIANDGRVRILTFDRPGALNAFNQDLWYAFRDALAEAATDDSVTCVVLTGKGRAFTAGQDLTELANPEVFEASDREPGYIALMPVVENLPKPLLAAVNGVGVGIGLTLLLHCDIVLLAPEARLRAPFASLGVTAEASSSYLLPRTVGWQDAAHIFFTEPWLDAETAVRLGLAWKIADDDVLEETVALARQIAELPLEPLMATKRLMLASRGPAVAAARERELGEFETLVRAMIEAGS